MYFIDYLYTNGIDIYNIFFYKFYHSTYLLRSLYNLPSVHDQHLLLLRFIRLYVIFILLYINSIDF